jgi:hypothetical protein
MSQKQFDQASLAVAAGSEGAVARTVPSQKPSNQVNLIAEIPQEILTAIQNGLNQQSAAFAKGLGITFAPPLPFKGDQMLTAGLSKSTAGLNLNLVNLLNGTLLALLRNLLGIPDLSFLPINISIAWTVGGGQLSGRLLPSQPQVRVQGTNTAPTFALAFLPQLIEKTKTNPNSVQFTIGVTLALSVQILDETIAAPPINLSVPLQLPTLPIPTLLGLFRHASFAVKEGIKQGFLMLVVPADSPFNVAGNNAVQLVQEELAELFEIATTLDRALGFVSTIAGFVLPDGLATLVEAIRTIGGFAANGINVTTEKDIANLNKVKMIDNPFFFKFNDIEAQNEITSLILIGGSGVQAKLFRRKDFKPNGVQLNVTPSAALVSLIRNLSHREPTAKPDSTRAVVPRPQDVDWELWSNKHFSDSISSLRVIFP